MKNGKKRFPRFIKSVFLYPFFIPLKWLYKRSERLMLRNARTNKISDLHNKPYHHEETTSQETSSFMVSCVNSREQQEPLQPSLLLLRQNAQGGGGSGTPGSTPLRQQHVVLPMTMTIDDGQLSTQQSLGHPGSATHNTKKKKKSPVSIRKSFIFLVS